MSTFNVKEALENPETFATLLHTICLRKYGEDWYMWDPSTVYLELKSDFFADVPSENMDKLSATQVLISSDAFFKDLPSFFAVCSTFSDGSPMFDIFSPPSLPEIAWSVAEASLNREFMPFSRGIKLAVSELSNDFGFSGNKMPASIAELLEKKPDEGDVQEALSAILNGEEVDKYLYESLYELREQFRAIPELQGYFDGVMADGVIPTVHKEADK